MLTLVTTTDGDAALSSRLFRREKLEAGRLSYEDIPTAVLSHPTIRTADPTEPETRKKCRDEVVKAYKPLFRALYLSMISEEYEEPSLYKLVGSRPKEQVAGDHAGLGGRGEGGGDEATWTTPRPLTVRTPFPCHCSRLTVLGVGQSWSEYGEAGYLGHDTSPEASCRRMRMRFTPVNIPSNSVADCSGPSNGFCHHQRRARCRGCRGAYSLRIELVNIPQTPPSHSH